MKKDYILLEIDLSLFGDGAAAAGAAAPAATSGQEGTPAVKAGATQPGISRRAAQKQSGGAQPQILYGKQPAATTEGDAGPDAGGDSPQQQPSTPLSPEAKRAKFRALINGEYKDIYTQEFQAAFDKRFRTVKTMQEQIQRQQPILDTLMERYKIADGDIAKLSAAIDSDDTYWATAAEDAGMTVDQYRQFQRIKRENAALQAAQRQSQARQAAQQQVQQWQAEGDAMRQDYPDFDFSSEAQNTQFMAMLKAGVPVRHAYEVAHLDAIKGNVAKSTAQQTEKQVVDGIRSRGTRPTENGVTAGAGVITKSDVSSFSRKDRAEIARLVASGKQITL